MANASGSDFTHGGGNTNLGASQISQLANIQKLQSDPNTSPDVLAQLAKQQQSIAHPDNGGYLGALGRIATGSGQTPGEQGAAQLLPLAAGVFKNILAQNALRQSQGNMQNASNQMVHQQRQNMTQGTGFNTGF